jgi:pyridoxal phosphate enzyme (YggS family)
MAGAAALKVNLAQARARIENACRRMGRDPAEVILVAVTKTVDVDMVRAGIAAGMTHLGENRPQELVRKKGLIDADVRWHLIGQLQRNKVKDMIGAAWLIHSLDRESLAAEIQKRAAQNHCVQPVLVEVNIAGEDTKSGMDPGDAIPFIEGMKEYPNLLVQGLMVMAPYYHDPEMTRPVFREAKMLYDSIVARKWTHVDMRYLSMGMSNDYEIAVEEGATMVRIGRALFGERVYG